MTRWGLSPSSLLEPGQTFEEVTRDFEIELSLGEEFFEGTAEQRSKLEPILARVVCHMLVQMLPDSAVPEACESLVGFIDFYRERPPARRALAQPREGIPAMLGPAQTRVSFRAEE
jgi:hypothetical protein